MNVRDALASLVPNAEWSANDTEVIDWFSPEIPQPTQAELDAEIARLQAEYDTQEYARNRKDEYPPIGDQLDALFHAGVFPADMAAQLQAVKDKYPK
tara:strand:- start:570 stop:860 length:291 start_codon:yes stop_codon:yes gene_type:complete